MANIGLVFDLFGFEFFLSSTSGEIEHQGHHGWNIDPGGREAWSGQDSDGSIHGHTVLPARSLKIAHPIITV